VIADAFRWASGDGNIPHEILLAQRMDRWGVQAVMNRPLYAYEVKRIEWSEYVVKMYNARKNTTNAAQFAEENQYALKLLDFAEKLVNDG